MKFLGYVHQRRQLRTAAAKSRVHEADHNQDAFTPCVKNLPNDPILFRSLYHIPAKELELKVKLVT